MYHFRLSEIYKIKYFSGEVKCDRFFFFLLLSQSMSSNGREGIIVFLGKQKLLHILWLKDEIEQNTVLRGLHVSKWQRLQSFGVIWGN